MEAPSSVAAGAPSGGAPRRVAAAAAGGSRWSPPDDVVVRGRGGVVAPAGAPPTDLRTIAARPRGQVQWRLVVGVALAGRARAWRDGGERVRCAGCGRHGRVVEVEVKRQLWTDTRASWSRPAAGRRDGH